ncbi:MAG: peptidylprolyl isomerase [Phycisphaerales bacterium]
MDRPIASGLRPVLVVITVLIMGLVASPVVAQITPQRVYYGVERAFPVTVERPQGAEGPLSLRLLTPVTAAVAASAPCGEGEVDLTALFPSLWDPTTAEKVRYLQLFAGESAVGPALVLQPLLTPDMARVGQDSEVSWQGIRRVFSGYRVYVDKIAVMRTTLGDIAFRMRPDEAPNTVWNFLSLADGGLYTDVIFHRIIGGNAQEEPFVVQVGDPTGIGAGGPGYFIDLERSALQHRFGVLSMARSSERDYGPQATNTNGSQVFICLSRERTWALDGKYTAFAEAVSGADTILALQSVETGENHRPTDPPVLLSVDLVDAPPYGTGPKPAPRPSPEGQTGR